MGHRRQRPGRAAATPNLDDPTAHSRPHDLGAEYGVVVEAASQIAAPEVTTVGDYGVYRLGGKPVRLRETTSGVAADGWMGEHASLHALRRRRASDAAS